MINYQASVSLAAKKEILMQLLWEVREMSGYVLFQKRTASIMKSKSSAFDQIFFNVWGKLGEDVIPRFENCIDNTVSDQACKMVLFSLRHPGRTMLYNVSAHVRRKKIQ